MRSNERIILIALPLIALCAGFWFLLIAPKRQDASDLKAEIETTNSSIAANEQQIASSEAARKQFPRNYGELVELGRAVPEDGDQSTLVYDMSKLGERNKLAFTSFQVVAGSGNEAPPAPPPPTPTTPETANAEAEAQVAAVDESASATPAVATEATAALLPLGASIGPAGLPVTPYEFVYTGSFFDVADFLGDVDSTVTTKSGTPVVNGRLMTVDGFSLGADAIKGFPKVEANLAVTTYIVPPDQGISGGATPAGPAPIASGSPSTVAAPPAPAPATPTATAAPTP